MFFAVIKIAQDISIRVVFKFLHHRAVTGLYHLDRCVGLHL